MYLVKNSAKNRRQGIDRRSFDYDYCIPERRSGVDRRISGSDIADELIWITGITGSMEQADFANNVIFDKY
ncbi:hypothetical protein PITCH_A390008 [uncultured Desulfobacterium sp.]|uniref:Uncharacterized protein n=1 Tax=uncultured Desulfobacterium sp. TaxID=201089 RepID=A0A445MZY5_9BACT|nr:hypothetical protein PITCH_A390008 [uncultured Desulfobacterium sp.]